MSSTAQLTLRMKAIHFPSGENLPPRSPLNWEGVEYSLRVSPVSTDTRDITLDSSLESLLSIPKYFPSGDHIAYGRPLKLITLRSGPPSAGIVSSTFSSFKTRTKAMNCPSGDQLGLRSGAGSLVRRRTFPSPINLT